MKAPHLLGVIAVLVMSLAVPAVADLAPAPSQNQVEFLGVFYCQGLDWCPDFAFWGPTAAGYIELTVNGAPDVYLWVDAQGYLTFEYTPLNVPPPAGLPLLASIPETGDLQEVNQYFPGGVLRPLYVESQLQSTPEPATLWMFGPVAVFLFNRARRALRG
jgi:hypothetical protein